MDSVQTINFSLIQNFEFGNSRCPCQWVSTWLCSAIAIINRLWAGLLWFFEFTCIPPLSQLRIVIDIQLKKALLFPPAKPFKTHNTPLVFYHEIDQKKLMRFRELNPTLMKICKISQSSILCGGLSSSHPLYLNQHCSRLSQYF